MPRPVATFKSYLQSNGDVQRKSAEEIEAIAVADEAEECLGAAMVNLKSGEVIVGQAERVLKFEPYTDRKQGTSGTLLCTNFRISFVTAESSENERPQSQRNKLLGENDIALCNIDSVYQVTSKGKRKKAQVSSSVRSAKYLEVHCKDFRVHTFGFKFTPKSENKTVCTAIVHHAFPKRLDLLFAFEFRPPEGPGSQFMRPRFNTENSWETELRRQKVTAGWKVVTVNTAFRLCTNLPECFVVAASLSGADLTAAAPQFVQNRVPTWSYTHSNGCALVRMAYLEPETTQRQHEHSMLEAVLRSHPVMKPPKVYDLNRVAPSIKDIQGSYERLKELCMPVSTKEIEVSDASWFSSLDATRWLFTVGHCLKIALRVADVMTEKTESVVLKEMDGRDLSCVISCLVQLYLDPYTRTQMGFQALIEREWVALGHKFTKRCALVISEEPCPVFLLFLDCVWQLLQQFPSAFQFSETYLTTVWDSVCLGMFETFLFDSTKEYLMNTVHAADKKYMMSAWDWSKQFDEDDLSLFNNPLYKIKTELPEVSSTSHNGTAGPCKANNSNQVYSRHLGQDFFKEKSLPLDILRPVTLGPAMKFWSHCYLRWLTPLQIVGGGSPSEYLQQCILVEEIICLQHKVHSLETSTPFNRSSRRKSDLIFGWDNKSTTTPKKWNSMLTSSFPFSPGNTVPPNVSFFGAPISMFVERSSVSYIETSEDSMDELSETESTVGHRSSTGTNVGLS